ncbi:MAG: tyrosine recombinase XerC [Clostridia bacterium]|nr:tyrosine recombinase XerC [Clostridia bacterium]
MAVDCFKEAPAVMYDFLLYLNTVKNKSPNTVTEYYLDLRTFFRYLKQARGIVSSETDFTEIDISDVDLDLIKTVTLDDAYRYMLFLQNERKNTAVTRSRKVSSLTAYFKYLTNRQMLLSVNPIESLERPKTGKRLPKYLTLEQCYDLLNAVEGQYKERDYCILVLFLNCGMRLSELCSIDYNSIQKNKLTIIGKGDKERTIYLNQACLDAIAAYMAVRPNDKVKDKYALFISRNNKRISVKTVQAMVNKYLEKIGLGGQGYSVHKLRHTAATLMYQHGGVDIRILKEILGHANLGTTEIYTHVSDTQLEHAIESNPLAKTKK